MSYNIIRLNRALFHVNLLSAPQSREHWKKNEVVAKPNSEEKKMFPDLINNHRIKLHLSITLSDLSRGENPSIYKAQPPTFWIHDDINNTLP